MTELVRLYAQIALLRRGPQDIPGSSLVLIATVLGYFVINFAVSLALPPIQGPWFGHLVVEIIFMLIWYGMLLRLARKPERFNQTTSAVFGYQAVLAPIWIASMWMVSRAGKDPTWQFPLFMLAIVLFLWMVTVNSQILRAALEWPAVVCVAIVAVQIVAGYLLLSTIFPPPR
jgi:hypothetical protein